MGTQSSVTAGPEATERAGAELAARLDPGDVVLVSGELGAGKTTFVVGHAYDAPGGPVSHLDLYRLSGMGDEDPGLLDPFFAPDAIVFIEWPEQGPGAWPPERVAARVTLAHAGGDQRTIEIA